MVVFFFLYYFAWCSNSQEWLSKYQILSFYEGHIICLDRFRDIYLVGPISFFFLIMC